MRKRTRLANKGSAVFRKTFSVALFFLLVTTVAEAQVYVLDFRDEKAMRPYRKYAFQYGDKVVLAGEVVLGLKVDGDNISWSTGGTLQVILLDPANPSPAPYKLVKGQRAGISRSRVAEFTGREVGNISRLTRDHDLHSLAKEYELRQAALEDLEKSGKKLERGTEEAERWHQRLLLHTARYQRWLQQVGFGSAASKLTKDLKKLRRSGYSMPDIVSIDVPPELSTLAETLLGDADAFAIRQSPHIRITYLKSAITEADVDPVLIFAEELIDAVRLDFILVYDEEGYEDWIPDEVFKEYYFGPEGKEPHKTIWERYYRRNWGPNLERSLASKGTRTTRGRTIPYIDYWRTDKLDYYDVTAHGLGHALADLHFNKWRRNEPLAWVSEAFAYYLSLSNLGRSNTFCQAYRESRYAGEKTEGGGASYGGEEAIHRSALELDTPIDTLSTKQLAQMAPAEVAKGVSFFLYLVDQEGLSGQLLLRSGCDQATKSQSFLEPWRGEARKLFEVEEGKDPLAVLDARWREWVKKRIGEK